MNPLEIQDARTASDLDKRWFGEHGASQEDLEIFIKQNPENSLALKQDGQLVGFATFEILSSGKPKDYVGNIEVQGITMFIHQFTTTTNYSTKNMIMDTQLLAMLEAKAKELGCVEVWEALSQNHPYSKEQNPDFDAYGFYTSAGYQTNVSQSLSWQPSPTITIPCLMLKKFID